MSETWNVDSTQTKATVSGRTLVAWYWKINPIWWFGNAAEQNLSEAPWYMPKSPNWFRALAWGLRNPLQNLRAFVIGVQDRNYTVTGKAPVMAVQRNDLEPPQTGFQWCWIKLSVLSLPFVSYSGAHVTWYAGWQPTGFFGFKFNISL